MSVDVKNISVAKVPAFKKKNYLVLPNILKNGSI